MQTIRNMGPKGFPMGVRVSPMGVRVSPSGFRRGFPVSGFPAVWVSGLWPPRETRGETRAHPQLTPRLDSEPDSQEHDAKLKT